MRRLKNEAKDGLTYVLIPIVLVLLPWRCSWWLMQRISRRRWLFSEYAYRALHNCQAMINVTDPAGWLANYRLNLLMDHVDLWTSMLMPWKLRHQHQCIGDFPESGAFVVIGSHWNSGFAILNHLHAQGYQTINIFRKRSRQEFSGRYIQYLYVRRRRRHFEKLFPGMRYHPGGYPRKVIKALKAGGSVALLSDVPARDNETSQQITLCGQPVKLGVGLAELAIKMQAATVFFRVAVNPDSGQRILELESKGVYSNIAALFQDFQRLMQRNLDESSSGWSMWPAAGQFFRDIDRKNKRNPDASKP